MRVVEKDGEAYRERAEKEIRLNQKIITIMRTENRNLLISLAQDENVGGHCCEHITVNYRFLCSLISLVKTLVLRMFLSSPLGTQFI